MFVRLTYNDKVRACVPLDAFLKHVKPLVPSEDEFRKECAQTVRKGHIPAHRW